MKVRRRIQAVASLLQQLVNCNRHLGPIAEPHVGTDTPVKYGQTNSVSTRQVTAMEKHIGSEQSIFLFGHTANPIITGLCTSASDAAESTASLRCGICSKKNGKPHILCRLDYYNQHMKRHHGDAVTFFLCHVCKKSYKIQAFRDNHCRKEHNEKPLNLLRQGELIIIKIYLKLPFIRLIFFLVDRKDIKKPAKTAPKAPPLFCDICGIPCSVKSSMLRHMQRRHGNSNTNVI